MGAALPYEIDVEIWKTVEDRISCRVYQVGIFKRMISFRNIRDEICKDAIMYAVQEDRYIHIGSSVISYWTSEDLYQDTTQREHKNTRCCGREKLSSDREDLGHSHSFRLFAAYAGG